MRRIGSAIITMMAASVIIFAFIHLIPGDPIYVMLGDGATPDQVEDMRVRLGLDKPIYIQYLLWLYQVLQGDLGTSLFFQIPVLSVISDGAETSLLLAGITMVWVLLIGIPIGMLAATRQGTITDQAASGSGDVLRFRSDVLGRSLSYSFLCSLARLVTKLRLPVNFRGWRFG